MTRIAVTFTNGDRITWNTETHSKVKASVRVQNGEQVPFSDALYGPARITVLVDILKKENEERIPEW